MKRSMLVAAAVCLLGPGAAAAKCAAPSGFFAPEAGVTLPPSPTLFLFASRWRDESAELAVLDGAGSPLEFTSSVVTSVEALVVRRIRVEATAGEVVLELRDKRYADSAPMRARYPIAAGRPRQPQGPVEILGVEAEASAWTCSYQATRNLTPSVVAPAYRVEWASNEADFRAGKRETLVLPYRMERFFHWDDKPFEAPARGRLELGHVNCTGKTFDWKGPIWVGIAALHEDGTEDPVAKEPVRIEPPPAAQGKGAPARQ